MAHLLHIDVSTRGRYSISRHLSQVFAQGWQAANPDGLVTYRDLSNSPVPHMDEHAVAAMFTPLPDRTAVQEAAAAIGEELIREVEAADTILIGTPMYNYSIPSVLKAWIDRVVVFGRTFDPNTYEGFLGGKRVVVTTARGGMYGPGTGHEQLDFQEPYLRTVLGVVGITDITFIHAEMCIAAGGDPSVDTLAQFAADSLVAAEAAVAQHAARRFDAPAHLAVAS